MAVAAPRRRADRDEHRVGLADRTGNASRKLEPPLPHVRLHQRLQSRLIDRQIAAGKRRDLVRILVDADHGMTEIGEAGSGDEPDIAGADHCDVHGRSKEGRQDPGARSPSAS